ncbi:MAG: hypothetical protein OXE77_04010 [Flavobacteriaceae bacterium]|nr:hypothetical protein [Flavobacteriaceae bacterium]MCY4267779.1 hypothetical protein [Flavobacteriaceae bacterium]MCY4299975.1 hypothetical protein [Flavobacteriaceae bacterium]
MKTPVGCWQNGSLYATAEADGTEVTARQFPGLPLIHTKEYEKSGVKSIDV